MAKTVRVNDPEGGGMPGPDGVPPLYPYDDKFGSVLIDWWQDSNAHVDRIRVSSHFEGDIPDKFQPFLSTTPYSGEGERIDQTSAELDPAFESELTPTQQDIFIEIEDKWGTGSGADTWTNKDVEDLTNATDSYDTVKRATKVIEDIGWATETGSNSDGKLRRLTQSRFRNPDAMTDGGGHDWYYNWEPEIEKLEERNLWDAVTRNPTKFDPRDWFAHQNEDDIIALFEEVEDVTETLLEVYNLRYAYETELQDEREFGLQFAQQEKVKQIKEIRDRLQDLQNSVIDFFVLLKNLASKFFKSCVNWWAMSPQAEGGKNIPEEYHPTKKKNIVRKRIEAKRWSSNQTHFDILIEGNPQRQAEGTAYPEKVHELEKSVRALIRLAWYMKNDLLEGTEPVENDAEQEAPDEGSTPEVESETDIPDFDELDQAIKAVEWAIPAEEIAPVNLADGMPWKEFLQEYREFMSDEDLNASTALSRLEAYHEWAQDADHKVEGVILNDIAGDNEEPDVRLIVVSTILDEGYFEDWPDEARWPGRYGLTSDERLIPEDPEF